MSSRFLLGKTSAIILSFTLLTSVAGCSSDEPEVSTVAPPVANAITPAEGSVDGLRIEDNTDVYKGTFMETNNEIALVVEATYREVASNDTRKKKEDGLQDSVIYQNAKTLIKPGSLSEVEVNDFIETLIIESVKDQPVDGYTYDVIVKKENITADGSRATLDLTDTAHAIDGKITTVTKEEARKIFMVQEQGQWFIDADATTKQ